MSSYGRLLAITVVPVLLAAVKLTDLALAGEGWGPAWPWWQLLLGFDVVFLVAGLLTFEFVLRKVMKQEGRIAAERGSERSAKDRTGKG